MSTPDAVRAVEMLAAGRRVTVVVSGKAYAVPLVPPLPPAAPPDPLELAAMRLLESDAQSRALLESVSKTFAQAFGRVDQTVQALAAGHAEVVESVRENTRTLHLPVKPVYDKDGKVIAAQRVKP